LRRWRPVARDPAWRRRWLPKDEKEAQHEVARWLEAPGHPEDLLERLLGPLVWLGARILERAAPWERPRMAEKFVRFTAPPKAKDGGFLEQELTSLNPSDFPRSLHGSLKQLGPLYLLLCRGRQEWFEKRLAERLETETRKMYLPPSLSKTRAGRLLRAALFSERPREALRELLQEVGWNFAAWAKEAGLHHTTITHLVAGKPLREETLGRLIDKLERKLAKHNSLKTQS
jgi:hypothetical protein